MTSTIARTKPLAVAAALAAFAALLLGSSSPAQAQGAWCSEFGIMRGGTVQNCGWYTFEQCIASALSDRGHCKPNPAYRGPMPGWGYAGPHYGSSYEQPVYVERRPRRVRRY